MSRLFLEGHVRARRWIDRRCQTVFFVRSITLLFVFICFFFFVSFVPFVENCLCRRVGFVDGFPAVGLVAVGVGCAGACDMVDSLQDAFRAGDRMPAAGGVFCYVGWAFCTGCGCRIPPRALVGLPCRFTLPSCAGVRGFWSRVRSIAPARAGRCSPRPLFGRVWNCCEPISFPGMAPWPVSATRNTAGIA